MDFFGRDKLGWVFDRLYFQLYGVFIGWFAFAENMFDGQKRGAKTTIVF
jgi:Leu/Phe-tRNA-protein transferase